MIRLKRAKILIRNGRQTSVKFRDFEEHISSLVFNKSLSSLAVLLILRRFFPVVPTDFPLLFHIKSWKNCGRVYYFKNHFVDSEEMVLEDI